LRNTSFVRFLAALFVGVFCASTAIAQAPVDITTWQNSLKHWGLNDQEIKLKPATVTQTNFGARFTQQTDGQTYGQPLFMSYQTLATLPGAFSDNQQHNVVYIATQNGSLYAFDADTDPLGANTTGTDSAPLWHAYLIPPGAVPVPQPDVNSTDILGPLSITTTPVIDPVGGTIYIVVKIKNPSLQPSPYQQYLHAIDLKTGIDRTGSPVLINASFTGTPEGPQTPELDPVTNPPGKIGFSPLHEHLRSAMVLYGGIVYLAYASHSDFPPYYGEILGYDANTLQLVKTFITTPNGKGQAGIWQSGAGPAIDDAGNIYVMTGNGDFDQAGPLNDWGESVLKLSASATGEMPLPFSDTTSWWTPSMWNIFNMGNGMNGMAGPIGGDSDLGSGGMLLLPDQPQGNHPHVMVGGGKAGILYLLDRDNLGGLTSNDGSVLQSISEAGNSSNPFFSTPSYFNGYIYDVVAGGVIEQRQVTFDAVNEKPHISDPPDHVSMKKTGNKSGSVFISANGTSDGIVWNLNNNQLSAFDATDISRTPLFDASANSLKTPGASSTTCSSTKFSSPIAVNGKVYFTCYNSSTNTGYLEVYGLEPTSVGAPPAATNLTATATSSSQIQLSWTSNSTTGVFSLRRSISPQGPFGSATEIGRPAANTPNFIDSNLTPGTTYYYEVFAESSDQSSISLGTPTASATTFQNFTAPGLVAYWDMDYINSPSVFDLTGNGHTGTAGGESGTTTDGYVNSGWNFHGTTSSGQIVVPNKADLQFTAAQSFTLSAWIDADTLQGQDTGVIVKSADQGNLYGIFINSANQWVARGPAGDLVGTAAIAKIWTNVTLVQDGAAGIRTLYINGVAQASGPAQAADGAGDLWIGHQNRTDAYGLLGNLDEVRIYNIALTPSALQDTLAPAILEVTSDQVQGGTNFPLVLFPALSIPTEPRLGSTAGTYTLIAHFATPVTGVTPSLGVQPGVSQPAIGNIASFTFDSTNTVATIVLIGVQDKQALNVHLQGILPISVPGGLAPTIAGTADIAFNVLHGDVSGDHVVDSFDVNAVKLTGLSTISNLLDINCDGVINNADVSLMNGFVGNTLPVQSDGTLALYKNATASTARFPASNAVDNDPTSRWDSVEGNGADPSSIVIDLNAVANIHAIVLNWEDAAGQNYLLQVSNDPSVIPEQTVPNCSQSNWTTIQTVTGNPRGDAIRTYNGLNATGRFVRMCGATRATTYGYSLLDFQVVGSYVPTQVTSAPTITSSTNVTSAVVGQAFSYQITASQSPTSLTATGLPAWLTVNASGLISGTPPNTTPATFTVKASNSVGTGTAQVTVTPTAPAPQAPANLTATSSTGQVSLSWSASTGATSYSIFRGTSAGAEGATAFAPNLTVTSYIDTAVTNGTTYFYTVKAVNSTGTSGASNEASATPPAAVVIPSAPTGLTAAVGNSQIVLTWGQSSGAASYSVFRGLTAGGEGTTAIAQSTAATFTDTNVSNGTAYFYKVSAANSAGVSGLSNEVSATPSAPQAGAAIYQIDSGSTTGVAPFVADEFFASGTASTKTDPVSTTGVTNPAPMAVYQSSRFGTFTYTIPALTAGNTYTVVLHFSENFWNAANMRVFDVNINSQNVLSAFDMYTAAGGKDIAISRTFSATANSSGQIVIAFVPGTHGKDNPQVNAIEILSNGSSMPSPAAPTTLFSTPGLGQVSLSWASGNGVAGTYSVFRGTAPGAGSGTPIATGLSTTNFIDTTVTNLTTYYYTVKANNNVGASAASNEVRAVPGAPVSGTPVYQIAAGSMTADAGLAPYMVDADFTGGNASGMAKPIDTTAVASPAPLEVYQSERSIGSFSYTFPNLTPGANYTVRLHFAEFYWSTAGQRVFNVAINGQMALPNFDIIATAGGPTKAVVEQFTVQADGTGSITLNFTPGSADQPKVSAIEIYQ
jgi:large repetitive protein